MRSFALGMQNFFGQMLGEFYPNLSAKWGMIGPL